MKKSIALTILMIFVCAPAQAGRFYFPGEKTEDQKKSEAREKYEERYQQQLDFLYLQDQESLVEYKREKRKLKLKKMERSLEEGSERPGHKPPKGPYLKRK